MPAPLAFLPVIDALGFGSQMLIAGALLLGALYILRLARVGSAAVGVVSTGATIGVALLFVAAVAIGLGWVSPNPSEMANHLLIAAEAGKDHGVDIVRQVFGFVKSLLP